MNKEQGIPNMEVEGIMNKEHGMPNMEVERIMNKEVSGFILLNFTAIFLFLQYTNPLQLNLSTGNILK